LEVTKLKPWREDPERYVGHDADIDKALRAAYYREPFAPYEIVLKDGRRLLIEEPRQISFPPAFPKISVALDRQDEDRFRDVLDGPFLFFKDIARVDLLHGHVKQPTA
jgi:hypothetical protein